MSEQAALDRDDEPANVAGSPHYITLPAPVPHGAEAEERIGLSRLGRFVRRWVRTRVAMRLDCLARQQRDQLHPEILRCGQRIDELEQLASTLASEGREDQGAVQTLRAKAGWRRNDLRWAAASVRCYAWITEDAIAYRANELLLAAAENRPVRPVTEQQKAWSEQLDALSYGWDEAAFARLVALQPRLADIDQVTAPIFQQLHSTELEGHDLGHARAAARRRIAQILDPIVGPNAESTGPLIRSHRAYELAERTLRRRMYERQPSSSEKKRGSNELGH